MLIKILTFFQFMTSALAGNSTYMTSLYTDLLDGYQKVVRPGTNYSKPTHVNSAFNFVSLRKVDEINAEFEMFGYFVINWKDERLAWDPSAYGGIKRTKFASTDIWIPYIMLGSGSGGSMRLHTAMSLVSVRYDGNSTWVPGDLYKGACILDVWKYPADVQECEFNFLFWGSNLNEIELVVNEKVYKSGFFTPNPMWILLDKTTAKFSGSYKTPQIIVQLNIERRQQFSIINILLPMLFISLGNVCVFLLPPDSGERIGFSITFLLAISVFITIVSDTLPQVSYPNVPLISIVVFTLLVVSIVIMVCTIYSSRCHLATDNGDIPSVVKKFTTFLKRRRQANKQNGVKKIHVLPTNKDNTSVKNEIPKAAFETEFEVSWKDVGDMFDQICVCVFLFVIVCTCMTFILIVKT